MMETIIQCLGSSSMDRRQIGGKTLGDLVDKLGDRVLPDIFPILEKVRQLLLWFWPPSHIFSVL
jgi:hypothetical protein